MLTLSEPLYQEIKQALLSAGEYELLARVEASACSTEVLTSREAAALLGVASVNTIKSWLEGGQFPGAYQTPGGHWRFPRAAVEAAKSRMLELRRKNLAGDILPIEADEEYGEPPLL